MAPFKWGAVPFGDSFFLNLPSPDLRPGLMNAAALGGWVIATNASDGTAKAVPFPIFVTPFGLKTGGEGVRTVKILVGSGIQMRGRGCYIGFSAGLDALDRFWGAVGIVGQECPTHTSRA